MHAVLLAMLTLASGDESLGERIRILSEKLALDLRDSRRCEVNPDNGYTQCHYEYQGLRFVRRTLKFPSGPHTFIEVESLTPGNVTVASYGGPCLQITVSTEKPEDAAIAMINVRDGRISSDGREIGCFPKARRK